MIRRTGILARICRRRWALSLAVGYAVLLNALLGTSVEAAMAAAGADPYRLAASTPICGAADPAPSGSHHLPANHQPTCPLCGPACPMGAAAALQTGPGPVALASPSAVTTAAAWRDRPDMPGPRRYASDTGSQGPPAA
jgi:hypothetical protein